MRGEIGKFVLCLFARRSRRHLTSDLAHLQECAASPHCTEIMISLWNIRHFLI